MKGFLNVLAFYYFLFLQNEVASISETFVQKGDYPYMAIIYYPDESVRDEYNDRFFQNAILIKPDWLLSASVDVNNFSYPVKTLTARIGLTHIDANFTFNEDEGEQEREVIQVIRPSNHNASQSWSTDISLLKTLMPFNITSFVQYKQLNPRFKPSEHICKILAFTRKQTRAEERTLSQITVELLPSTLVECGNKFLDDTMSCGVEEASYKNLTSMAEFCQDNAGGPLICEDEIIGIQTFIKDEPCVPPRLFQLISGWNTFLTCGTEYNCNANCEGVCTVIPKDIYEEISTVATTTINIMKPMAETTNTVPPILEFSPTTKAIELSVATSETREATIEVNSTKPETQQTSFKTDYFKPTVSTESNITTAVTVTDESKTTVSSRSEDDKVNTKDDIHISVDDLNDQSNTIFIDNTSESPTSEEIMREAQLAARRNRKRRNRTRNSAECSKCLIGQTFIVPLIMTILV